MVVTQLEVIYSIASRWQHPIHKKLYYGKVRFLGTSLHPQCLAEKVDVDTRFKSLRFSILQDKDGNPDIVSGKSIWEDNFPTEELYAEMKAAESNGRLGNWLQERMNMPYKYGDRIFDGDNTRYWNVGGNRFDVMMGQPCLLLDTDIGINYNLEVK